MKVCNRIKGLIDEAAKPDALSFEVSNHLSLCADCKSFASERAALRQMLVSVNRVSVPVNFDAMLKSRIADAKAERAFSWLGASSFMKLGAATAAVAMLVFVAQYSNLFSNNNQVAQPGDSIATATNTPPVASQKPPALTPQELDPNNLAGIVPQRSPQTVRVAQMQRDLQRRSVRPVTASAAAGDYPSLGGGGVVLVRGSNGEREVSMPTISVGAQPLLYVNAGRSSQPARTTATSF